MPSRWRNDAPQVINTSSHDCLNDAQLPCLILRHLLESFLYSVKGPFRGLHFSFCILPNPILSTQGKLVSSFCEYNQYHCSTPLAPASGPVFLLVFLSQLPLETFLLFISRGNNIPTSLVCTVLFPSFSITFHDAPFAPQTHTTATLSMVCLFLPPEIRCDIAGINCSCITPHPPLSPPTQTARN